MDAKLLKHEGPMDEKFEVWAKNTAKGKWF